MPDEHRPGKLCDCIEKKLSILFDDDFELNESIVCLRFLLIVIFWIKVIIW